MTSTTADVAVEIEPPPMKPGEVAALFRVDPKTVTRWAQKGRLKSFRTPGGHRRFREADVQAYLDGGDGS